MDLSHTLMSCDMTHVVFNMLSISMVNLFSIIKLLWSLMSKMSTKFRSVSYRPYSRTGVTCVASDFGGMI